MIITHRKSRLGAVLLLLAGPCAAAESGPVDAVNTFFEAMAGNNWDLAATVMIDDAVLYGYRVAGNDVQLSRLTVAEYLDRMSSNTDRLLERIWDVQVIENDRLASVWTPYDFFLNGEFHHCGTNTFSLIRDSRGWRIAGVVYSIETEDCPPSPLGPPEEQ